MNTMKYRIVMLTLALSLLFSHLGFAVEIPTGVTLDNNISQEALTLAKQQFVTLKQNLTAFAQNLPPDQKGAMDAVLVIIEEKLNRLDRIEVYFAQENAPGAAFTAMYDFYKNKLSAFQEAGTEELQFAVAGLPPNMLPEPTVTALSNLIDQGKVKVFMGGSGKSRVSVLTVYLNPKTFELIEKTTVVIATEK